MEIIQIYPNINFETGKIQGYDTAHAWMYTKKNLVLFKFEYTFDSSHTGIDGGDSIPKIIFHSSELRYEYLVYEKGKNQGVVYDKYKTPKIKVVPTLDSLLKTYWIYKTGTDSFFITNKPKLISIQGNKNSDFFCKTWLVEVNDDNLDHITATLCYKSKFSNTGYSFSNRLDTVGNMKLNNMKYEWKVKPGNEVYGVESFKVEFMLKKPDSTDLPEIQNYFSRFIDDFKRMKGNG